MSYIDTGGIELEKINNDLLISRYRADERLYE